ncbi:hypothetical protein INR49_013061, partial [Caranx melampygus]
MENLWYLRSISLITCRMWALIFLYFMGLHVHQAAAQACENVTDSANTKCTCKPGHRWSDRFGSVIVDFELTIVSSVDPQELIKKSEVLAKNLKASIDLKTTGIVLLETPKNHVMYNSTQVLVCKTSIPLNTTPEWTLRNHNKIVDIGLGSLEENSADVFSRLDNITNETETINSFANLNTSVSVLMTLSEKDLLGSSSNMLDESLQNSWTAKTNTGNLALAEIYLNSVEKVSKKTYLKFSFFLGYMCPSLIVIITFICNDTGAEGIYYHEDTCWLVYVKAFQGSIHAFIIPVGIIVFVNVFFMLVVIMKLLTHAKKREMFNEKEKAAAKTIMRTVIVLTPTFGVTWIFGFGVLLLDLTDGYIAYVVNYAFTLLNAFQTREALLSHCRKPTTLSISDVSTKQSSLSTGAWREWSSRRTASWPDSAAKWAAVHPCSVLRHGRAPCSMRILTVS